MNTIPASARPERRLRLLWLDPQGLLDCFASDWLSHQFVALPQPQCVPPGTRFFHVFTDEAARTIGVVAEHP